LHLILTLLVFQRLRRLSANAPQEAHQPLGEFLGLREPSGVNQDGLGEDTGLGRLPLLAGLAE
jgi:hypothetical protein